MSYFQNPFFQDFRGALVLGDRKHQMTFECPQHAGRDNTTVVSVAPLAANNNTFDLSGNDRTGSWAVAKSDLEINFAIDPHLKEFASFTVDCVGSDTATTMTVPQIVDNLNADTTFSSFFTASIFHGQQRHGQQPFRVYIKSKRPAEGIKFYISNSGAEVELQFNYKAGVAELPTYFGRHTVDNIHSFEDCCGLLIALDPVSSTVDADVIDTAIDAKGESRGFDSSVIREDWELFEGRSGIFEFTNVVSASETIIYPAGAGVGDLAKKIITDSGNTFEIPYTLTASDLITPP